MALHPRPIFAVLVVVASALPAGCAAAAKSPKPTADQRFGSGKLTAPEIQAQVWTFADRFVSSLSQACDELASGATPAARREANRLKLQTAHAAWSIAAIRSPIAALIDMIVMVRLENETVNAYWNPKVFDGRAGALVTLLQKADADLQTIARQVLDAEDLKTLADSIEEWRAENPDQVYTTHVRFTNFAWTMRDEAPSAKKGGSGGLLGLFLLDPLAGLDPATREIEQSRLLAERFFYYMTRLQSLLAWQVEQVYNDLLSEPNTQQVIQDIHGFTGASERFAASTETLPQRIGSVLSSEREAAVEQIRDALATERAGLVRDLAAQEPVLRGLLFETRQALEAGTVLANSISATAETVASLRPSPASSAAGPPGEPFDLKAYEAAAAQTTQAAAQLNELVTSLQGLAASGDLEKRIADLDGALGRAESGGRRLLNHAFLLAAGIVVLIFAASIARLAAARKFTAQR